MTAASAAPGGAHSKGLAYRLLLAHALSCREVAPWVDRGGGARPGRAAARPEDSPTAADSPRPPCCPVSERCALARRWLLATLSCNPASPTSSSSCPSNPPAGGSHAPEGADTGHAAQPGEEQQGGQKGQAANEQPQQQQQQQQVPKPGAASEQQGDSSSSDGQQQQQPFDLDIEGINSSNLRALLLYWVSSGSSTGPGPAHGSSASESAAEAPAAAAAGPPSTSGSASAAAAHAQLHGAPTACDLRQGLLSPTAGARTGILPYVPYVAPSVLLDAVSRDTHVHTVVTMVRFLESTFSAALIQAQDPTPPGGPDPDTANSTAATAPDSSGAAASAFDTNEQTGEGGSSSSTAPPAKRPKFELPGKAPQPVVNPGQAIWLHMLRCPQPPPSSSSVSATTTPCTTCPNLLCQSAKWVVRHRLTCAEPATCPICSRSG